MANLTGSSTGSPVVANPPSAPPSTPLSSALGNAWSYAAGNCTFWAATVLNWIPAGLGNANQWLANAKAKGLTVNSTPSVGAAAVMGGPGYSSLGHVGVVTAVDSSGMNVTVSEMNYTGLGQVDSRVVPMSQIQGFIQPPATVSTSQAGLLSTIQTLANGGVQSLNSGLSKGAVTIHGPFDIGGDFNAIGSALSQKLGTNGLGSVLQDLFGGIEAAIARVLWVALGVVMIIVALLLLADEERAEALPVAGDALESV